MAAERALWGGQRLGFFALNSAMLGAGGLGEGGGDLEEGEKKDKGRRGLPSADKADKRDKNGGEGLNNLKDLQSLINSFVG